MVFSHIIGFCCRCQSVLQERRAGPKIAAFRVVFEIELVLSIGLVHNGDIGADAEILVAKLQDISERSASASRLAWDGTDHR